MTDTTTPRSAAEPVRRATRRGRRVRVALAGGALAALVPVVGAGSASAIDGGTDAQAGFLPYVAEVIYTPPPGVAGPGGLCTGTLVHPRWVLTAQHCAETVAASTLTVRVGHTQRGTGGTFSTVTEIRKYPGYTGGHNDIALLRLSQYITNVPRVRLGTPAEAGFWDGQQGGYFTQYDDGLASGWGANKANAYPARLQFRGVSITTPQPDALGIKRILLASAGPCGGDSGGPLLVSVGGTYVQAGVLKAAACGYSGASYSEVGAGPLRDWVRTQIPDIDSPNPATCKQGYVWRVAYAGDVVCVTPATRTQAYWDNYYAPYRRDPYGAWGPYTCISGYVWRVAKADDLVCVTPAVRDQTAYDNAVAATRVN